MTFEARRSDDDSTARTFVNEREGRDWINSRTMPWEFYLCSIPDTEEPATPSAPPPRWQPAISLDGEAQVFFLFRADGTIHMEDGKIVRFPDDIKATHAGLAMDLAEYRERKAAEKEASQ